MKERPILFQGSMVRAILEGRKTQTRRVVKPSLYVWEGQSETDCENIQQSDPRFGEACLKWVRCPYGIPGDRLWVRETFVLEWPEMDRPEDEAEYRRWLVPHYAATESKPDLVDQNTEKPLGWRPSIFMPRWACRLVLEVTEVRVQRVAEISEKDAKAEGVDAGGHSISPDKLGVHRGAFAYLWSSINGRESWDANPFVWAITFRRVPQ